MQLFTRFFIHETFTQTTLGTMKLKCSKKLNLIRTNLKTQNIWLNK